MTDFKDLKNVAKKKANDTVNDVKENASSAYESVKDNVKDMKQDASSAYKSVRDNVGAVANQVQDNVHEYYNEGKKKVEQAYDATLDYKGELIKLVKGNPLSTVIIAGSIGYLLSKIFNKSNNS